MERERMVKTILVADDNSENLELLSKILTEKKFNVLTADNGLEALDKIYLEKPDLILLDIMMPKMDGHEVLRNIRQIESDNGLLLGRGSKIVMTTALSDKDTVMAAFRGQCDGYLVKPITKEAVQKALQKLGLA